MHTAVAAKGRSLPVIFDLEKGIGEKPLNIPYIRLFTVASLLSFTSFATDEILAGGKTFSLK
jgi:hypothetical protein